MAIGGAILGGLGAMTFFGWMAYEVTQSDYWDDIIRNHFAAVFGLPGSAALAFIIVVFLRQTDGPIVFKGLGFELQGAAGQVIMWVICFLALAGAIKLCW